MSFIKLETLFFHKICGIKNNTYICANIKSYNYARNI